METKEFIALLKEHGTISVGINSFDPSEIFATYTLNGNDVCVVDDTDGTSEFLLDIRDETALEQFQEEILDDVENYSWAGMYEEHLKNAIEYVKEHIHGRVKDYEFERAYDIMDECRCPLDHASDTIVDAIRDLMDDYTLDEDLPEDWWYEHTDIEDIFWEL